jgi:hypothetical protein
MANGHDLKIVISVGQRHRVADTRNLNEREKSRLSTTGLGDIATDCHDPLLPARRGHTAGLAHAWDQDYHGKLIGGVAARLDRHVVPGVLLQETGALLWAFNAAQTLVF